MSNRISMHKITPYEIKVAVTLDWSWFSLRDATGHIRDWTVAIDAKSARKRFASDRPNGIVPGSRVERGRKVEADDAEFVAKAA